MTINRRTFSALLTGAVAAPRVLFAQAKVNSAFYSGGAQAYPAKPVRIIVGFTPGGATDILARLIGQWFSERLGQSFLIENRTGGGGNIATETVVKAPADGHTLLMVGSTNAINSTLYDKLNFDLDRDIAPVAGIIHTPMVMVVSPSVPVKTVAEFIAYAKTNPNKLNMGSGGIGSGNHLAGELFKMIAGINMLHVPYRGAAPALADMLGGHVQVIFTTLASAIEYIKAGKLRLLAVTSSTRLPVLPEVPTAGESLPGYEVSYWLGLGAPKNTPTEIINVLNKEINAALIDSKIVARLSDLGGTVLDGSPADFGKLIAEDTEKWGKVIRAANIRVR